jgi:hypothetical protein
MWLLALATMVAYRTSMTMVAKLIDLATNHTLVMFIGLEWTRCFYWKKYNCKNYLYYSYF